MTQRTKLSRLLTKQVLLGALCNCSSDELESFPSKPALVKQLSELEVFSVDKDKLLESFLSGKEEILFLLEEALEELPHLAITDGFKQLLENVEDFNTPYLEELFYKLSNALVEGKLIKAQTPVIEDILVKAVEVTNELTVGNEPVNNKELETKAYLINNSLKLIELIKAGNSFLVNKIENKEVFKQRASEVEVDEPPTIPVIEVEDDVSGLEGAVFDAIKEMGTKALQSIKDSFDALSKYLSPQDLSDFSDKAKSIGDKNKKALNAMEDKALVINSSAREGIVKLAEDSDPSGKMKNIVSTLRVASDGPRVIDALISEVNSITSNNKNIEDSIKEVKKNISDLETSTRKSTEGDESNKDVVTANREEVKESIAEAKEGLKKFREEIGVAKKSLAAYIKAISGIYPKIFVKVEEE